MRRWPVIPTIVVAIAVAAMIGLGLWQLLDRRPQKIAYLEQLRANPTKPPIAFPRFPDETLLFRRATGFCLSPKSIRLAGAGAAGFRAIVECSTGAEGPGMVVQLGTTRDPNAKVAWPGGAVSGYIANAPDGRSLIGAALSRQPQRPMLVAGAPPPGLQANAPPNVEAVSNNHLAYAVQWFFFAAVAVVIYVLAVRRRRR